MVYYFRKPFFIAVVFASLITQVYAAPTANHGFSLIFKPLDSHTSNASFKTIITMVRPNHHVLATVGGGLYSPPKNLMASSYPLPLPALPTAVLMVLTGFICVTLVKDHKTWHAAFATLLWISCAVFQIVPRLHLRLPNFVHAHVKYNHQIYELFSTDNSQTVACSRSRKRFALLRLVNSTDNDNISNAAIHSRDAEPPLLKFIFKPKQFICFSPEITFDSIPRGPPA